MWDENVPDEVSARVSEDIGVRADWDGDNSNPSRRTNGAPVEKTEFRHRSEKMSRSALFESVLLRHEKLLKKQTSKFENRLLVEFANLLAEFARLGLNDQKALNHEFRGLSFPEPLCVSSLTKVSVSPFISSSAQIPEPGTPGLPDLPSFEPEAPEPPPRSSYKKNSFRRTVSELVLPDRAWISRRQNNRNAVARCVWKFLDDPESSGYAWMFNKFMPWFTIGTVLFTVLGSTYWNDGNNFVGILVELVIDTIFTLEFLARLLTCPSMGQFFFDAYNIIDVVSVAPLIFRVLVALNSMSGQSSYIQYLFLCYVPVLRLLKLLRRFRQCRLLLEAFVRAFEALPVILFCYCVILLFFSSLIFSVERWQNSRVNSILDAMWLTVVSMTTVGYGDVVPITPLGKVIAAFLTLVSLLYMAVPLGIIGNCFGEVWNERDKILLKLILKQRLAEGGYTAFDVPELFRTFDKDGDQLLDFGEFAEMVEVLRLGLNGDRITKLFNFYDGNGGGTIDDEEFVKATFPNEYHQMFCIDSNGAPGFRTKIAKFARMMTMKSLPSGFFGSNDSIFANDIGQDSGDEFKEGQGSGDGFSVDSQ